MRWRKRKKQDPETLEHVRSIWRGELVEAGPSREERRRRFVAETHRAGRATIIARGQGDPEMLALWLRVAQGCEVCSGDGITWPGGELCPRCGTPERAQETARREGVA